MNYHIVLTKRCNLNCTYCLEGEEDMADTEIRYSMDQLAEFLDQDENLQLMFYGGERIMSVCSTQKG